MATGWEIVNDKPPASPANGGWAVVHDKPPPARSLLDDAGALYHTLKDTPIPGIQTTAGQIGSALKGEVESAGTALLNIPHNALSGAADFVSGGHVDPDYQQMLDHLRVSPTHDTQGLSLAGTPLADAVSGGARAADRFVEGVSPTALDAMRQTNRVTSDVGAFLPAVGAASVASDAASALSAANAARTAEAASPAGQAGLSAGAGHPIAGPVAGESGKVALNQRIQSVAKQIASNEAGHGPGPMSAESMADAREAPSSVFNRLAAAFGPYNQLDDAAVQGVRAAGAPEGGRMSSGSPVAQAQIQKLQDELTDPNRNFSGDQLINEMRALRQEGHAALGSDDISQHEVGRAKLDMARAVEAHIGRNIPADANVSAAQFSDARTALAKNHTVQSVLRGGDVDLQALARMDRANPGMLTGGLKQLADFAANNRGLTNLMPGPVQQPSFLQDLVGKGGTNPESLLDPGKAVAVLGGRALARRALTGSTDAAIASANRMFPRADPGRFGPLAPPEAPPGTINFQPPGGEPPLGLAVSGTPPAVTPPGGIPFADVLSHGVEKPPEPGLSLGEAVQHPGIPFTPNLEHAAGGLQLAPEDAWFHSQPPGSPMETLGKLADAMSQGVPEGILARTQQRPRGTLQSLDFPSGVESPTRVASLGESLSRPSPAIPAQTELRVKNDLGGPTTMERVNRAAQEAAAGERRFLADPDAVSTPIHGGEAGAEDRVAPRGSVIYKLSADGTPEILDRGGLPQSHARGLVTRALDRRKRLGLDDTRPKGGSALGDMFALDPGG